MTELATNVPYYGDNLDVLRCHLPDASVDLVYLDPPWNEPTTSRPNAGSGHCAGRDDPLRWYVA